jgi:putative ABC transport system ATP-binding protein
VITVLLAAADRLGAALVVATHDPVVARRLTERWSMAEGRLNLPDSEGRA